MTETQTPSVTSDPPKAHPAQSMPKSESPAKNSSTPNQPLSTCRVCNHLSHVNPTTNPPCSFCQARSWKR